MTQTDCSVYSMVSSVPAAVLELMAAEKPWSGWNGEREYSAPRRAASEFSVHEQRSGRSTLILRVYQRNSIIL
jgi:hypothetical protein